MSELSRFNDDDIEALLMVDEEDSLCKSIVIESKIAIT